MFQITKVEPKLFFDAKSKVSLPLTSDAWSRDEIAQIRPQLRKHILSAEQKQLCSYCEKKISDDSEKSNIDHFKTRNLFPEKTLEYDNLLVSCNTSNSCANYKDKHIKNKSDYDNIINPTIDEPDDFFDYLLTGEIVAIDANKKANFTIGIFNLGYNESDNLTQTRRQIAEALKYCTNLSIEETHSELGNEFYSFINIVYGKLKSEE